LADETDFCTQTAVREEERQEEHDCDCFDLVRELLGELSVLAEDLDRLDRCEGHPRAYRRRRLLVDTGEARRRRVHVYVKDAAEQALPTEAYFGVLWRAYHRHGFDAYPLAMALGGDE
jgi:hypothetical protein